MDLYFYDPLRLQGGDGTGAASVTINHLARERYRDEKKSRNAEPASLHYNGRRRNSMSAKVKVRNAGDVAILDMAGRITLGDGSGMVRNSIKELVAGGTRKILLNLHDVTYLDSAGLGELVGSYATITNLGGQIKLLHPQGKVTDMLTVTKLYTIFNSYTDEGEALRSFQGGAAA
jgi:anti-sigma B factor antagonist